jgi:hypothetical protein
MRSTILRSEELSYAIVWEQLRAGYFQRLGRHKQAFDCWALADTHEQRLACIKEE